jgi:hypothetical protein
LKDVSRRLAPFDLNPGGHPLEALLVSISVSGVGCIPLAPGRGSGTIVSNVIPEQRKPRWQSFATSR